VDMHNCHIFDQFSFGLLFLRNKQQNIVKTALKPQTITAQLTTTNASSSFPSQSNTTILPLIALRGYIAERKKK